MSLYIAYTNLKSRTFRTTSLVIITTLLAAFLFGGLVISACIKRGASALAARLGADILIVAEGYDKQMEGILLRGEPTSFYLDSIWLERIASVDGVSTVSPQLYAATLNSECCSAPVQLIGYEPSSDFLILPWIKTALPSKLEEGDIVVGGMIMGKVGDEVKFFNRTYRIAAKMESTGTGFDTSIFMPIEAARRAAFDGYELRRAAFEELEVEEQLPQPPPENAISAIAVIIKDGESPTGILRDIYAKFGYNSGIAPVAANSIVNNVSSGLRIVTYLIGSISILLWAVALLALSVVFSALVGERKYEFGLMRSIGATRKRLAGIIFMESSIITVVGSLMGLFAAALVI
ncbi:MAG: ABC transporter permease, partial [Deferribacteraceae bacterium]|nr:ABC transporter permease [Deferribacteraceae bacterium]